MEPKRNSGTAGRLPEISARNQDRIRNLIKVELIVKKLNDHILGKAKMTNTMVRAAEILLRKIQPDLTAIQVTQDDGQGIPLLKIVRQAAIEHVESEANGGDRLIEHVSVSSSKVMPD
jgi:hypothetical protein